MKSTSPVINRILWTLLAVGVVSLFIGVTFAGGPWSVQAEGERLGCGMPFMGRYAGQPLSSVDPMARAAYFCYLQASNRRIMAFWFGGVGLLVLFVAVGWISLTTLGEGRTSPGTEPAYVEQLLVRRDSTRRSQRAGCTVSRFDLIIFDCDGVLVDSERLAVRTEAEILSRLGWPLTPSEIGERFVGRSAVYMQQEIERHVGRSIDWDTEFEPRYREIFERELVPVPGVTEALDQITSSTCVASSGSQEKLRFTLGLTGLFERFEGRIFSADEVEHGKPAPDIFLHAAEKMGVAPARCAVIEDSVSGVTAALAAHMAVFALAGGVTGASELSLDGAVVFDEMKALPQLLLAG